MPCYSSIAFLLVFLKRNCKEQVDIDLSLDGLVRLILCLTYASFAVFTPLFGPRGN